MTLVSKILETVNRGTPKGRGFSAEEVNSQLKIPQPAPDVSECRRIVADELIKKHIEVAFRP
jgi:hypothetical protein